MLLTPTLPAPPQFAGSKADGFVEDLGGDDALGAEMPEALPQLWSQDGLEVSRWGTVKINPRSFETALPGVFAAGDIVRGASLVVWAIRDGRDAAGAIHEYLRQQDFAVAAE